jgi:hypothetical protein
MAKENRPTISIKHLFSVEELSNQFDWENLNIPTPDGNTLTTKDFSLVAVGIPNIKNEKWDMDIKDNRYAEQEDLIYALVVNGKLLKIGKSITTMAKRVQSYHCGKNAYRSKPNATNSATNWFILQSVLSIGRPVYIYVLYIPRTEGKFMGWSYHNRISKEIEGKLLLAFETTVGYKPIGNKQS